MIQHAWFLLTKYILLWPQSVHLLMANFSRITCKKPIPPTWRWVQCTPMASTVTKSQLFGMWWNERDLQHEMCSRQSTTCYVITSAWTRISWIFLETCGTHALNNGGVPPSMGKAYMIRLVLGSLAVRRGALNRFFYSKIKQHSVGCKCHKKRNIKLCTKQR